MRIVIASLLGGLGALVAHEVAALGVEPAREIIVEVRVAVVEPVRLEIDARRESGEGELGDLVGERKEDMNRRVAFLESEGARAGQDRGDAGLAILAGSDEDPPATDGRDRHGEQESRVIRHADPAVELGPDPVAAEIAGVVTFGVSGRGGNELPGAP